VFGQLQIQGLSPRCAIPLRLKLDTPALIEATWRALFWEPPESPNTLSGRMTVLLNGTTLNQAGPRLGSYLSPTRSNVTGFMTNGGCSPYAYTLFIIVNEWLQSTEAR
jgi:hypothetical protein